MEDLQESQQCVWCKSIGVTAMSVLKRRIHPMNKTIKKQFWITPEDDEILKLKCEKACLSEAALMRYLIRGYEPREKPDERFYKSMNDLSAIGRNINQIVAKANTLNFVDAPLLAEELNKLKVLRTKIEMLYLRPVENDKWQ